MPAIQPRHVPAFLAAVAFVTLFCFTAGFFFSIRGEITEPKIDYKDFVSILLTAVTIILGAVALGIAALAIWGYKAIIDATTERAQRAATAVAKKHMEDYLTDDRIRAVVGPLLQPLVDELAAKLVQPAPPGAPPDDDDLDIPTFPETK